MKTAHLINKLTARAIFGLACEIEDSGEEYKADVELRVWDASRALNEQEAIVHAHYFNQCWQNIKPYYGERRNASLSDAIA